MQVDVGTLQVTSSPHGSIGAILEGVHPATMSDEETASIRALIYEHKLVIVRDQVLSKAEYVAFARRLGRPQIYFQPNYHHPDFPEIFVSSNVEENGQKVGVAGTGRYWHTDYQFFKEPLPLTMQYPQVMPSLRETFYIDMERVLRELPPSLAQFVQGDTRAVHDGRWRYKVQPSDIDRSLAEIYQELGRQYPGVTHPLVITHPVTGVKSLYASSGFTVGIAGRGLDESGAILKELFAFIEQPEHVYTLQWRQGDIAIWDNRTLLHKAGASPKGEPNVSYRIGVYDDLPFYV